MRTITGPMTGLCLLAAVLLLVERLGAVTEDDVIPRISFPYNTAERPAKTFSIEGVSNYTALLLRLDDDTLYVGARETLFALRLQDIASPSLRRNLTWETPAKKREECRFKGKSFQTDCFNYIKILLHLNSTHLYVCGTYAFSPICAYINTSTFSLVRDESGQIVQEDGRSRCPFNPDYKSTAIIVDGELYAGTVSNFQGNEPVIYRSLGEGPSLKTENSLNWLQDPSFVGSAHLKESHPPGNPVSDDDKVYFFFSETGKEFDFFDNTIVSRIARVCKGDKGGERVLQKKWTTFLKAQLLCSLPDDGFPFNIIQDMFVLTPDGGAWENTVFYGVFTSQWYTGASGSSAVCAFTMAQVEQAFTGRYREVNRETQQWYTYNHPPPTPRPGACVKSSLHVPDKVLNFVKDHFLMDNVIRSTPLLLKRSVRYTQIAVHKVQGMERAYDVLFIGTDDGKLHKAINSNDKMHIIEEMTLFSTPQPVQHMELDARRGLLYISSYSGLVEVAVANCSNYQGCGECVLSRDPYCAWSGRQCLDVRLAPPDSHWQQDVEEADTNAICNKTVLSPRSGRTQHTRMSTCQKITLPPNSFRVLPCPLRSNLAARRWVYAPSASPFLYPTPDGGLVVVAQPDSHTYECWSHEEAFTQLLANYCVRAEPGLTWQESTTLIGHSRTPHVDQSQEEIIIILPEEAPSTQLNNKTYWAELVGVCGLLAVCLLLFFLLLLYSRRGNMKALLKDRDQRPSMQQKARMPGGKPAESLPLNGTTIPVSTSDHKGYQTLNDNYISTTPTLTTPTHESSPDNSKSFSEVSERRPLNVRESHVEISEVCPRPRVRLGSEIKDSIV
ncbi:hypothetical protein DPEC_G00193600 [Dallia pectoralis]|uniref:Uncharacterized protein n=1 Tax=Dallia pectoralis TaxID=75939 RepID=A0ACC2G746_DALPE|nr:hypothetical protein DPEC_G00193600 [Dallia pectoralis]